MNNEKFIIKKLKPKGKSQGWRPITISMEIYEKLSEVSDITGLAISQVASKGLEFALGQVVIED